MSQLTRLVALVTAVGALASFAPSAEAKYRYGKAGHAAAGAGGEDAGFFLLFEGGIMNPRNTDAVVATIEDSGALIPVIPVWGDEFSGRLGAGWTFSTGDRVSLTYWGFNATQADAGSRPSGGTVFFAVGPPIDASTGIEGGYFDLETEVDASTIDAAWSRVFEPGDAFELLWSAGLRYANYKETTNGLYDEVGASDALFGQNSFDASKVNEADMIGVRVAVQGRYFVTEAFSMAAGLGFSFLDGELKASSGLTPSGTFNGGTSGSFASLTDDSRSGTVRDLDLTGTWHAASGRLRVWIGWEQQVWDQIPLDLMRGFPGSAVPLRERSQVVFSGYKAGVSYKF